MLSKVVAIGLLALGLAGCAVYADPGVPPGVVTVAPAPVVVAPPPPVVYGNLCPCGWYVHPIYGYGYHPYRYRGYAYRGAHWHR